MTKEDVDHIFTDLDFTQDFQIRQEALEQLDRRINEGPVDTREALKSFSPSADLNQHKVIESTNTTIRLVAPAGSGKTQTVVNRVLFRVKNGHNPDRMLVLTFDNSAAFSLRDKVQNTIGKPLEGLKISTLNAYGYMLLREYFPDQYKQVIPEYKPRRLLKEIMEALKKKSPKHYASLPTNVENRFYLEFFSLLKNSIFDPRNLIPQEFADFMLKSQQAQPFFSVPSDRQHVGIVIQAIIWLFKAYEKVMQRDNVIDFDDQKLRAYLSLKENQSVLRMLQARIAEVIVDEFQDINRLDFILIKILSDKATLVVVGDDDQAIYGFRGCTSDFIIDLENILGRKTSTFELQINYRCPPNIVVHADKLIRNNKKRIPKTPIAHSKIPAQIKVASTLSAGLEAKSIVSYIKRIKKANPSLDYKDVCVLYRTNAQSLPLQIQFILTGIPYFVGRERDNILLNETLERLLGVLRLKLALQRKLTPTSRDALLSIKSYFRYVSAEAAEKLESLFERRTDFLTIISSEKFFGIIPKAKESKLASSMQEVIDAQNLMTTLDVLAKRFNGLHGMIGSLEDVIEDRVPLGEVYDLAVDFKGNIADFVNTIDKALEKAKSSKAGRQEESGVKLLTYFKAKGLQWHTVILTTCNDGLIPHSKAPVEDERRLFYVAMTRASANLLVSYVKNVCGKKVPPSRFLKEAGLI